MMPGTSDHDAPGVRCEGLAHLDRLAVVGALYEPKRPRRRSRAIRWLRAFAGLALTAAVLVVIYGALVVT